MKLIAFIFPVFLSLMFAQRPTDNDWGFGKPDHDKIEMMKMWKLTEHLDLSEEQAAKFFPRYKALEKELQEMDKSQGDLMKQINEMMEGGKEVKDKELNRIVKKTSDIQKQKIDKKWEFVENLGEVLTPEQKAKYIGFEIRFKHALRDAIRDHDPKKKRSKRHGRKRDW